MKKIFVLLFLIYSSIFLSRCGLSKPTPIVTNSPNTIDIQNFSFNPPTLTIKKGETVTWVNHDTAPHQIKSDTFTSPSLSNGQNYTFTFTDPGTFSYVCSIHPSMAGKIIVQ